MNMKLIHKFLGICIMVGLSLMIAGFATGGAKYGLYVDLKGVHIYDDSENNKIKISEDTLEAFTSIDIDSGYSKVEFINSDKYGLEISCSANDSNPEWSLKDGRLKISDGYTPSNAIKIMNFNFSPDNQNYIRVYFPKDADFEEVSVSVSAGDVAIGGFAARNTKITNRFGDVKIENINSSDFNIELSSGNFKGKNLTGDSITYKNSFGSSSFDNLAADNITAVINSGKIEIGNSIFDKLDVKNHFGDIVVINSTVNGSKIDNDSGDIRLSGDFTGKTDINSNFGDVKASLSRVKEYYSLNLSTSFGEVKIDNKKMGNATIIESSNEHILTIKNKSGDIEVSFKE